MADDGRETKIEPDDVKSELSDLDDSVVAEESAAEAIRKLREKLNVCQSERREYLEGWQRAKADYVNTRREEEAARARFLKFSREDAIKDILPALDSFHSAFGDKAAWEKVDLNWRMGVQYIYSQLLAALLKSGVTFVDPKPGDTFDEGRHESVATVPGGATGTIAEVVQKGYSLHGKILQPAKVKIFE
ncbi:MAG: nucleotide exchange factor GrpE [Patescibacteria group bacterium]